MTNRSIPTMRAPDFSLRVRGTPPPSASTSAPSPPPPLSREQRAYLVSGIESRPYAQRKVCPSCASALRDRQRQQVFCAAAAGECLLCAAAEGKPEAFTQAFCDFLTENPTVFHAVEYFEKKLQDAGFTEVWHRSLFTVWGCGVEARNIRGVLTVGNSSPRGTSGPAR